MNRTCAACGKPFEAKRSTAKFCGSSCRANVSTGVAVLRPAPVAPEPLTPERGPQEQATWNALAEAGRETHPMGVAALVLSRDIDARDTPVNARTQAIKQLSATLADALKGAAVASAVDELRSRRDARRTG